MYKIIIIIININDVFLKLNILNFKKSQNNIKRLINIIKDNYIAAKSFTAKYFFFYKFYQ